MPDVVTVQYVCVHGTMEQLAFERLGNRRFSSAGKAGQPNDRSAMAASHRALASGNFSLGPKDVFALCSFSVGINTAEIRDMIMIVDYERPARLNCQSPNFISLQLFAPVTLHLQCG